MNYYYFFLSFFFSSSPGDNAMLCFVKSTTMMVNDTAAGDLSIRSFYSDAIQPISLSSSSSQLSIVNTPFLPLRVRNTVYTRTNDIARGATESNDDDGRRRFKR